jgi:hypothetical protein
MAEANNQRGKLAGKPLIVYKVHKVGDFLSKPGLVLANVKPDDEGVVEVTIPDYEYYSHLQVFINDPMSSVSTEVALPSQEANFIDTRLSEGKKEGLVYSDNRYAINLTEEGQRASVNDLNNTKYSIISSLGDVFKCQKLLATYSDTFIDIGKYEEWKFLTTWGSLSLEEKLKIYEKYMGHELNVFLYFKDVDFFSQYVSNHIEHKSSKELIDYFLIGDVKNVKK